MDDDINDDEDEEIDSEEYGSEGKDDEDGNMDDEE